MLPLVPWRWTVLRFAGEAFIASNDQRRGAAVGSFRSRPARFGAVPGFEMAPCSRAVAGGSRRDPCGQCEHRRA